MAITMIRSPLITRTLVGAMVAFNAVAMPIEAGDKCGGGGDVLPPTARPHGYSLEDMAAVTAYFNSGPRLVGTEPETPFQILYVPSDASPVFRVCEGTKFYVPLLWSDNSEPVLGDIPDVKSRLAVANYYFDKKQLGARVLDVIVDGDKTSLKRLGYPVGAVADTYPGGTEYTTVACFLSPMKRGTHTVVIRTRFTGNALSVPPFDEFFPDGVYEFEASYTVIVE